MESIFQEWWMDDEGQGERHGRHYESKNAEEVPTEK